MFPILDTNKFSELLQVELKIKDIQQYERGMKALKCFSENTVTTGQNDIYIIIFALMLWITCEQSTYAKQLCLHFFSVYRVGR